MNVRGKDESVCTMRIGELSAATRVSIRLLRYYEERGLLRPQRTLTGQRVFDGETVDRVGQIRELLAAGLTTDRIRDLLPCFDAPVRERSSYLVESLREERANLDRKIASLLAARVALDQVINDASSA